MVGTTDEGEPTKGRTETHGGEIDGATGPPSQPLKRNSSGPCLGVEKGACSGTESEKSWIGFLEILVDCWKIVVTVGQETGKEAGGAWWTSHW